MKLPAILAFAILATGCKDDCGKGAKSCEPIPAPNDAGPVADAPNCPIDIDPSQSCPAGCEEIPQFC